jgi:hypothetical protein
MRTGPVSCGMAYDPTHPHRLIFAILPEDAPNPTFIIRRKGGVKVVRAWDLEPEPPLLSAARVGKITLEPRERSAAQSSSCAASCFTTTPSAKLPSSPVCHRGRKMFFTKPSAAKRSST